MSINILDKYKKLKWKEISSWKTKTIYAVDWTDLVIMENNDNLSAWDGAKMEKSEWKAICSTEITSNVFEYLNSVWIKTHFRERLTSNEILVEKCEMLPVECVFRFVATWSYIKREKSIKWDDAIEDNTVLDKPIIELFYKNDVLDHKLWRISDPMIKLNPYWIPQIDWEWWLILLNPKTWEELTYDQVFVPWTNVQINWLDYQDQVKEIEELSTILLLETLLTWNQLKEFYTKVWITVFDWKVEFWKNLKWELVLADVIDWDSCRLRDVSVVEWTDWKNYILWDYIPEELDWIWWKNKHFYEKMEKLPEWMWIKKIVQAEWLDKQWFRDWESAESTVDKYKILAEKSAEALEKSKDDENKKNELINNVSESVEKIL
jgi:phosphoribosylaminoimidazole-succinocarboxamide synthase